jgi:hypothetical protein
VSVSVVAVQVLHATRWCSEIPESPWGSGGGVRRSGVPECSRFISALELEEEEGLV